MGRRYSVDGTTACDSSADSVISVISASTIRPAVYDIIFGSNATPADNALTWLLQRFTADGTGTSVTPIALDSGDPSATGTSKEDYTAEPTYTANAIVMNISANQRATTRWVASPGGELKCPATAANGLGMQPSHASFTGNVQCTMHYEE